MKRAVKVIIVSRECKKKRVYCGIEEKGLPGRERCAHKGKM